MRTRVRALRRRLQPASVRPALTRVARVLEIRPVTLMSAVAIAVGAIPATADECTDYEQFAHWVGGTTGTVGPRAFDADDDYIYVADVSRGLTIWQQNASGDLTFVGGSTPFVGLDVRVRDGYAYVAAFSNGLVTIDVRNPAAPNIVATYPVNGFGRAIDLVDGMLYVGVEQDAPDGELRIYDAAANPSLPVYRGVVNTPWQVQTVRVRGDYAFVIDTFRLEGAPTGGIGVYDVSDPDNPSKAAYRGLGVSSGLAFKDSFAFVASETFGFWVLDLTDPLVPIRITYEDGYEGEDVAVIGETLWVSGDTIRLYDISNPRMPDLTGQLDVRSSDPGAVDAVGDLVVVGDGSNVYLARSGSGALAAPTAILPVSTPVMALAALPAVAVAGDSAGLRLIDLEKPANPVLRGSLDSIGSVSALATAGTRVVAGNADGEIALVDVSDLDAPLVRDVLIGTGEAIDALGAEGNLLAFGESSAESHTLALATHDGSTLTRRGAIGLPAAARDVAIDGTTAAVAMHTGGFLLADVSDPMSPSVLSTLVTGGRPVALDWWNDLLIVADELRGLVIVDAAKGGNPIVVAQRLLPSTALTVQVEGGIAWLGVEDGIFLMDVRGPEPLSIGFLPSADLATLVVGDVLLAGGSSDRVDVYAGTCEAIGVADALVTTPTSIRLVAAPNPFLGSTRLAFELSRTGRASLSIFDVTGRRVRTLIDDELRSAGPHDTAWDGRDEASRPVQPGAYFYVLDAPAGRSSGAITRLR